MTRTGSTHASLVDFASKERPALMRVEPGDPGNSWTASGTAND